MDVVDPVTAKTLVSLVLVLAIALFSAISCQAFLAQVIADLRGVRARGAEVRAGRSDGRDA